MANRGAFLRQSFTTYVQQLGPHGEPPDLAAYGALLDQLRAALVHELKKRSLWEAPTSYLGVVGSAGWADGEALEELLLDCYEFIFIRRFKGIQNQLLVRENVDGLVFLNIRHFLHEAQKRHDPLGYRIFEMLQTAAGRLLASGQLHVLAGDPRIRNDTILGFVPWAVPELSSEVDLGPLIATWNHQLLPDLVTAWNKESVLARLEALIAALPDEGVDVFEFRDLIEPMKSDIRARWQALQTDETGAAAWVKEGEELIGIAPLAGPGRDLEARDSYQQLMDCMGDSLDQVMQRAKTKDYLRRLWLFLRAWAAGHEAESRGEGEGPTGADTAGRLPPDTKLGKALAIPRERIPGLKATLGRLIEACRGASGAEPGIESVPGVRYGDPIVQQPSYASAETRAMDLTRRREQLRLATGEVAGSVRDTQGLEESPRPGDTYVLKASCVVATEWLLLANDPADPRRVRVAPVDDLPLVGSGDVALSAEEKGGGVTSVRCGQAVWVDVDAFETGYRTGQLPAASLARLLSQMADLDSPEHSAPRSRREVDDDPEYVSWMRELAAVKAALPGKPQETSRVASEGGESSTVTRFDRSRDQGYEPVSRSGRWVGYAIAASLAVAVVGLSLWVGQLRDELARPIVIPGGSGEEIVFSDTSRTTEMVTLKATASHVIVHLILSSLEPGAEYRLDLVEQLTGRVVWASEEDVQQVELTLMLPRAALTVDRYRFRLFARDEVGEERLLEEHEVRIDLR